MGDILEVVQDGVKVNIAIDIQSALITSFALFIALTLALLIYGKVIRS